MTAVPGLLEWNAAPSNIERFKQPAEALQTRSFGFQGYPERYMFSPKRPMRNQPSADNHNADVNRYFRKEPDNSGPNQGPPSPGPGPKNEAPSWLQDSHREPGPAQAPKGTISPRYHENNSYRQRTPVVRDPLRELTSAEKRKKIDEHYRAQEDLAEAKARRHDRDREQMEEKLRIREMQEEYNPYGMPGGGAPRGDNRKMKFTEHQMTKPESPAYGDSRPFDPVQTDRGSPDRHFRDRDRRIDAVKENMDRMKNGDYTDRSNVVDMLSENEREINNLKHNLAEIERDRYAKNDLDQRQSDLILSQERKLRDMGDELRKMKHGNHRNDDHFAGAGLTLKSHAHDHYHPEMRAQSEPLTDRPMRKSNRDRDFWGSSNGGPQDYLGVSPRQPMGKWYSKESIYKKDFDRPEQRHGTKNLKNPNWDHFEPFDPFGAQGGGAPLYDNGGQRNTKIRGTMRYIGREGVESAKAKRAQKMDLHETYERQLEEDRMKKQQEKMMNRAGFTDFAVKMRDMSIGKLNYDSNGMIGNHHLPHKMSSQVTERPGESEKKSYYNELKEQVEHKTAMERIGKLEDKNQANAHFHNFDNYFGNPGGGARKGNNLKKLKLNDSIYNTHESPSYYHKVRLDDDETPEDLLDRFKPRITINSTHKNLYEFPDGSLKTNYRGLAPYAAEFQDGHH